MRFSFEVWLLAAVSVWWGVCAVLQLTWRHNWMWFWLDLFLCVAMIAMAFIRHARDLRRRAPPPHR